MLLFIVCYSISQINCALILPSTVLRFFNWLPEIRLFLKCENLQILLVWVCWKQREMYEISDYFKTIAISCPDYKTIIRYNSFSNSRHLNFYTALIGRPFCHSMGWIAHKRIVWIWDLVTQTLVPSGLGVDLGFDWSPVVWQHGMNSILENLSSCDTDILSGLGVHWSPVVWQHGVTSILEILILYEIGPPLCGSMGWLVY